MPDSYMLRESSIARIVAGLKRLEGTYYQDPIIRGTEEVSFIHPPRWVYVADNPDPNADDQTHYPAVVVNYDGTADEYNQLDDVWTIGGNDETLSPGTYYLATRSGDYTVNIAQGGQLIRDTRPSFLVTAAGGTSNRPIVQIAGASPTAPNLYGGTLVIPTPNQLAFTQGENIWVWVPTGLVLTATNYYEAATANGTFTAVTPGPGAQQQQTRPLYIVLAGGWMAGWQCVNGSPVLSFY